MKSILLVVPAYIPGFKMGGPIRSAANLVDWLGDEFAFRVLTADRDLGDLQPYPEVKTGVWQRVGKADVMYLSPAHIGFRGWYRLLNRAHEDEVFYVNSLFSFTYSIKLLLLHRLGLVPRAPFVVAPRGELSPGALALKTLKKRTYLLVAKAVNLYRDVTWHASNEYEAAEIRRWFGEKSLVKIGPNLPARAPSVDRVNDKIPGQLKIVFLSRINRMKNLDAALRILKDVRGDVHFNIYGPMEDQTYWAECQKSMALLPSNIRVEYRGSVEHEKSLSVMAEHHLFFMPTLGENYGHVIMEAMLAGCPVLISDQTPWRGLEQKGVGWDVPLRETDRFRCVMEKCVGMGTEEFSQWSGTARAFALEVARDQKVIAKNRALFEAAPSGSEGSAQLDRYSLRS